MDSSSSSQESVESSIWTARPVGLSSSDAVFAWLWMPVVVFFDRRYDVVYNTQLVLWYIPTQLRVEHSLIVQEDSVYLWRERKTTLTITCEASLSYLSDIMMSMYIISDIYKCSSNDVSGQYLQVMCTGNSIKILSWRQHIICMRCVKSKRISQRIWF